LDIPTSFYEFLKFKLILGILLNGKKKKNKSGIGPGFRPKATVPGHGVAARTLPSLRPERHGPLGPAPG
jgi:hypothetical protein